MNQTRLGSLIEAMLNVGIGFVINMAANFVILPLVGFNITLGQNLFIGVTHQHEGQTIGAGGTLQYPMR